MPQKPADSQIADTIVYTAKEAGYVCCSCKAILFYVEEAAFTQLVIKCHHCGKMVRIYLGVEVSVPAK